MLRETKTGVFLGMLKISNLPRFSTFATAAMLFALSACGGETNDSGNNNTVNQNGRDAYPEAPYGKIETSVIDNLSFKNTDETEFKLEEIFKDEGNRLLLISTSAGWCTSCIEEQQKLQARHDQFSAKGLYILLATFEDAGQQPATPAYAKQWQERFNLSYKVVADEPFLFQEYYDRNATPMVMLVDVDNMQILKIMTGFDESVVDAIIDAKLGG